MTKPQEQHRGCPCGQCVECVEGRRPDHIGSPGAAGIRAQAIRETKERCAQLAEADARGWHAKNAAQALRNLASFIRALPENET